MRAEVLGDKRIASYQALLKKQMDKIIKETAEYLQTTRRSVLDDIPDNFAERIMAGAGKGGGVKKEKKEVKIPEGFTVAINYNKGGYQVIPKKDV